MIEEQKNYTGRYIVLEGPEGVGKTTQIDYLAKRLQNDGHAVKIFREPDSQTDLTARAIRQITQDPRYPLNTKTEVLLYNAARSQSLNIIREARAQGVICIVDRNYLTTLAVQYYGRGDVSDYQTIMGIIDFAVGDMHPDITIILDAPVTTLQERAKNRGQGERFDNLDLAFLERVRAGYLIEAKKRNLPVLHVVDAPDVVHEAIWKVIKDGRPISSVIDSRETATIAAQEPSITAEVSDKNLIYKTKGGQTKITKDGREYLKQIITDTIGDVYAFTENLNPVTISAAMARLSRRGDDMRITLLDEFVGKVDKDKQLLKRVITAYGDDSVQQLTGLHVVVENASNLLTKKLEWGRLAAYLEQSTRYIYYDQKNDQGHYKYYTPTNFDKKTRIKYQKTLNHIFDLYSEMAHKLTEYVRKNSSVPKKEQDIAWKGATRAQACDAIRNVLPVATNSTVGIYASAQALESLIMHLQSDELPEAKKVGQQILNEARKVIPTFLERADKPERGGALVAYRANTYNNVKNLSKKYLTNTYSADPPKSVTLTNVWPHNELDLVADMVYEHSDLPLETIKNDVAKWTYKQKEEVFKAYIGERLNRRHRPGRAIEKAHYSFDLVCDYGIFRDLQRHRMVDDLNWQQLTPRYGYDIPELVEKAGLSEQFLDCFDSSLELHSYLQSKGYELEAQYSTLLGHLMRWKVTYNAREAFHLHEIRTSPQGHPGYRKLVLQMHEEVTNIHPLLAESMKFVNQDEDPELTRLAGERYTQFKLNQLKN